MPTEQKQTTYTPTKKKIRQRHSKFHFARAGMAAAFADTKRRTTATKR
jgi:hypothetical protein